MDVSQRGSQRSSVASPLRLGGGIFEQVVTGKPAGSDLPARKKYAPVVAALAAGTAGAARLSGTAPLLLPIRFPFGPKRVFSPYG